MGEWIRLALDLVMMGLLTAGLVQATRLLRHLRALRQSQAEMARFVQDFSATVSRAETGIKALKQAARESGDDLEKLVEKATMIRDELQFITESADQIAGRLTKAATDVVRMPEKPAAAEGKSDAKVAESVTALARKPAAAKPASRAERELLQALEKLG